MKRLIALLVFVSCLAACGEIELQTADANAPDSGQADCTASLESLKLLKYGCRCIENKCQIMDDLPLDCYYDRQKCFCDFGADDGIGANDGVAGVGGKECFFR